MKYEFETKEAKFILDLKEDKTFTLTGNKPFYLDEEYFKGNYSFHDDMLDLTDIEDSQNLFVGEYCKNIPVYEEDDYTYLVITDADAFGFEQVGPGGWWAMYFSANEYSDLKLKRLD